MAKEDADYNWLQERTAILMRDRDLSSQASAQQKMPYFSFADPYLKKFNQKQNCLEPYTWVLPLPIGGKDFLPPVPNMSPRFTRESDVAKVASMFQLGTDLRCQRVAYDAQQWGGHPSPCHPGHLDYPRTFNDWARLDPAFCLHFWHYAQGHLHAILGQQKFFLEYLDCVHYVGGIWHATEPKGPPPLYTTTLGGVWWYFGPGDGPAHSSLRGVPLSHDATDVHFSAKALGCPNPG